jgi:hypothetical protein
LDTNGNHFSAAMASTAADDQAVDELSIFEECSNLCRLPIILAYFDTDPGILGRANDDGHLPLHLLLYNDKSSIDIALRAIKKYPAALRHQNNSGDLPIHIECNYRCRPSIIATCIELYPQALSMDNIWRSLPLHMLLNHRKSSADQALMMIEKYPAALQQKNLGENLPLHLECINLCRSSIISKCIELYPDSLSKPRYDRSLPCHNLLSNELSSVEDALMMIEKYPAALQHAGNYDCLPIHIECMRQFRPTIMSTCIKLYPEALRLQNDLVISMIIEKINKSKFDFCTSILSAMFTAYPMCLYARRGVIRDDIRDVPYYRRRILNLLPRHVFTPTHESDYQDLNWQPRAAMMIFLSQMKRKEQESSSNLN